MLCSACVRLSYLVYNLNISHNHSLQQYLITESVQLLCLTHTHCVGKACFRGETLLKTLPGRAGPGMKPNVALGVNVMIFSTETM